MGLPGRHPRPTCRQSAAAGTGDPALGKYRHRDRGKAAFAEYWEQSLAEVDIDPDVAEYLMQLTTLQNFPRPFRLLAPFLVFVTTGFLPPVFREAMGLAWSTRQQRRFDRMLRAVGALERRLPGVVRVFPFNLWLTDMRLRRRFHRPLV